MDASILKLLGQLSDNGRVSLEKLRVYGILGGSSDFDICRMYPVFPSSDVEDDDISGFFLVYETSKKLLRFNIL